MSLPQIVDDLADTLADLVINAGEDHLESELEALDNIEFPEGCRPSDELVALMEELYTFDADQLAPPPCPAVDAQGGGRNSKIA